MDLYEEKYKKALEKARELMDKGYDVLMPEIFPELNESEDEKIKREIVAYINELADLKNEKIPTRWLDWLEKQGEQTQFDYEHANITQKDFAPIEPKMLNADKVIEWLRQHICTACWDDPDKVISKRIKNFKKDFKL